MITHWIFHESIAVVTYETTCSLYRMEICRLYDFFKFFKFFVCHSSSFVYCIFSNGLQLLTVVSPPPADLRFFSA